MTRNTKLRKKNTIFITLRKKRKNKFYVNSLYTSYMFNF